MTASRSPGIRILIADDDRDFGMILQRVLTTEGHECDLVSDASKAAEALAVATYDLLIADIDMPGNRSLEFVQSLADAPDRPPIILMTGSPTLATATKSVGLAVLAYITKPFQQEELRKLIREATTHGRVRRAVLASEERIHAWSNDLAQIRELIRRMPTGAAGAQAYISVTLSNLVAAVNDFAEVAGSMLESGAHKQQIEKAALVTAVRETIEVLENTRTLFKSKELGALRKKLESLVG